MRLKGIIDSHIPATTRLFRRVAQVTAMAALTALVTSGSLKLGAESDNPTTPNADGPLVQVVLTATAKHDKTPEPLKQGDVLVYKGRDRLPVVDLKPAQGAQAGLDLVILIDDGLDSAINTSLGDLKDFIRSRPSTTRVAVAYTRNGSASIDENFTADHEQTAKALRMPLGSYGAFTSPYLSVIDLIKRLPETGNRREILLVSDGIDRFRGSFGTYSPDLQPAVELAQRNGIVIYTIYARGLGRTNRNSFLIMNAQGGLTQLAQGTGGEAFFEGINSTPISLRPYLDELSKLLEQQYLLAFRAEPAKKDSYEHFKFTTEVPNVELIAPNDVFVPGTR
jgi:VWFA-related protein